jgi:hypothetical protein
VVIRRLTVEHVSNDGYNIHGAVKKAEFRDCHAHHCGDEGFSSHDDCETLLDGAVYTHCCNGIFNVGRADSVTRNAVLAFNRQVGYGCHHETRQRIENVVLVDNPSQLSVGSHDRVDVENLLVVATADMTRRPQAIAAGGRTRLRAVTTAGNGGVFRTGAGAEIVLENCLFAPAQGVFHVRADDPMAILSLRRVVVGAGTRMEWGSRYPWKSQPFEEWAAEAESRGIAEDVAVAAMTFQDDLVAGRVPADLPGETGCARALLQRYVEFLERAARGAGVSQ